MPVAKFQMPDGRIGRFEVPEGTSPEQAQSIIAASIGGQQAPQERSWGDVATSAISNIPSSAVEFGKSIAHAVTNPLENIYSCGSCGVQTHFEQKTIPYAVKLWSQELEAMHIVPRMVFE